MKKFNLIPLLLLNCILFSCEPKKEKIEKKEPVIIQNYQNYKLDDEPVSVKADDSTTKAILTKKKIKRSVE